MSTAVRAALASAVSAVEGVIGTPYYQQAAKAGTAFPQFIRTAPDESGFDRMDTWQVYVILPQDIAAAEKWIDARVDSLHDALEPLLIVTSAGPQVVSFGTSTAPALVFEGVRAHNTP